MIVLLIISLAISAGTVIIFVRGIKTVRSSHNAIIGITFALAVVIALAIGIKFGICYEFHLSNRVRFNGVPIPIAVLVLEKDGWTDFVIPFPYLMYVVDVLFSVGIIVLLWIIILKCLMKLKSQKQGSLHNQMN